MKISNIEGLFLRDTLQIEAPLDDARITSAPVLLHILASIILGLLISILNSTPIKPLYIYIKQ